MLSTSAAVSRSAERSRQDDAIQVSEWLVDGDDDWTNETYDQNLALSAPPRRRVQRRVRASVWSPTRIFVLLFSLMLAVCGACVAYVCASPARAHALVMICTGCDTFLTVGLSLGVCLCATGLVSVAVVSSTRCWKRSLPATLVSLVFLAFGAASFGVAAGALYLRFGPTVTSAHMDTLWVRAVAHRPALVCDVERSLHCSGFHAGHCCVSAHLALTVANSIDVLHAPAPCYFVGENNTMYDPSTLSNISWPLTDCPVSCSANQKYNRACRSPLAHVFTRTFTSLCTAFLAVATTFFLFAYLTWAPRGGTQQDTSDSETERVPLMETRS